VADHSSIHFSLPVTVFIFLLTRYLHISCSTVNSKFFLFHFSHVAHNSKRGWFSTHSGRLQATFGKLQTNFVLRPTQHPILSRTRIWALQ